MRLLEPAKNALAILMLLAAPAVAAPSDVALEHFRKGCLEAIQKPSNNYAYFSALPGFRAWGPMKAYQNRTSPGKPVKMGIFTWVTPGKSYVTQVSKSFKPNMATCRVEFAPTESWESFFAKSTKMIKGIPGYEGPLPIKNKRITPFSITSARVLLGRHKNGHFSISIGKR